MKASKFNPISAEVIKHKPKQSTECFDKKVFKSRQEADSFIGSFIKNNPGKYLRSYSCNVCNGYHTSSKEYIPKQQEVKVEVPKVVKKKKKGVSNKFVYRNYASGRPKFYEIPEAPEEMKRSFWDSVCDKFANATASIVERSILVKFRCV